MALVVIGEGHRLTGCWLLVVLWLLEIGQLQPEHNHIL
jgi:hypothetical protein